MQTWPTIAACWSPRTPPIRTSPPNRPSARVRPNASGWEDGWIVGSIDAGTPKNPSSSASQSRVSRSISIVRLALVTSVTCRPPSTPPVRFHSSQLSVVPQRAFPASAAGEVQQQPDVGGAEDDVPGLDRLPHPLDVLEHPLQFPAGEVGGRGEP